MKDKPKPEETPEERAFYRHLDACRQCRERPFDLCGVGAVLIVAAINSDSILESLPHE